MSILSMGFLLPIPPKMVVSKPLFQYANIVHDARSYWGLCPPGHPKEVWKLELQNDFNAYSTRLGKTCNKPQNTY